MRIVVAHSFYRRPGGEDAYVRRQVELLRTRHEVALLARENTDLPGSLRTAVEMIYSPRRRREAEKAIEDFQPDVVHVHNVYPAWGPAFHLAADRTGTPLVMTVHNLRLRCPNGVMFTQGELCTRCVGGNTLNAIIHDCLPTRRQAASYAVALWTHRYVLKLQHKVDLFIAPSRFVLRRLHDWGIEDAALLPHAVHVPPLVSPAENCGLYLGRLAAGKGVDILLRALVAAGDPPFRIAGDGPLRSELEELSRKLQLQHAEFVGHSDPSELLSACRYVVVPSLLEESFGLTVAEAMSHGRPVIATRRGGLPEMAENGRAISVDAGDVEALAGAIDELRRDPDHSESTGIKGRAWVEKELNDQLHLSRLEDIYHRLRKTPAS